MEAKTPGEIAGFLRQKNTGSVYLVRTRHEIPSLVRMTEALEERKIPVAGSFCAAPNPREEKIREALSDFRDKDADAVVAVGGGSVIDTAKCLRFFSGQKIPLVCAVTTAGSGSEATHFATVYRGEEKISVADDSLYPDVYLLDTEAMRSLSREQRTAGMADAACHAIESLWSRKRTQKSREKASLALRMIWQSREAYLGGDPEAEEKMMRAAHLAGEAIDISYTTAGHAMSYLLTARYGMPHGLAAAVCVKELLTDLAAQGTARERLSEIADAMGAKGPEDAARQFEKWIRDFSICVPKITIEEAGDLADRINLQRLENYPADLTKEEITALYSRICSFGGEGK